MSVVAFTRNSVRRRKAQDAASDPDALPDLQLFARLDSVAALRKDQRESLLAEVAEQPDLRAARRQERQQRQEQEPDGTLTTALESLAETAPGEVIALYIFILASANGLPARILGLSVWQFAFVLGIALCVFIVLMTRVELKKKGEIEKVFGLWALFAPTSAFIVWALAIPTGTAVEAAQGQLFPADGLAPATKALWGIIAIIWWLVLTYTERVRSAAPAA